MNIALITLFPEMFSALTEHGVSGRAVKQELVNVSYWNPRDYTTDRHRTVDDRPYGGGPGMLMKTQPVSEAIEAAVTALQKSVKSRPRVIYLSPQGKPLRQEDIAGLAKEENLVLLCGRYEGVDERVINKLVDEEYSLGDYVISGGELAAMVLMPCSTSSPKTSLRHV